ncbi:MAG TPA: glutathione S-transferase C-terminal domain-containing protein, partial [Burkholderiaceae bacterium]|nr:glutathione S-transferase C-terminal domain-containing protein [Burkholderiaceae bacterium]
FSALRGHCVMNIEASLPDVGARVLAEQAAVRADLARIDAMWLQQLAASGGPFLFGRFGIVDAFYAPVVSRVRTYGLPLSSEAQAYAERVWAAPGVAAWVREALAEQDFIDFEEPYRKSRT